MTTNSENIISKISSNVFFKEFTFDKNDFYPEDGKKELADTILWLDDMLFIIQIKERNPSEIKSENEENKWFDQTVIKKAKQQISKSIEYLNRYSEIKIRNVRNHSIDISKTKGGSVNKVIIYMANGSPISDERKSIKIYESKKSGNIHIFSVEDYLLTCKVLITPTELDEYLKFRGRFFLMHQRNMVNYPENYILGHFLNTDDETLIHQEYENSVSKLVDDSLDFDVSIIVNGFWDKIKDVKQKESQDYYFILTEIAKLKRYELVEFKKRLEQTVEDVKSSSAYMPYRFTSSRTGCGFVFIPLPHEHVGNWENALYNFTAIYKYKRRLNKCLGVVIYKMDDFFDINWSFTKGYWAHDKELEDAVNKEAEFYGSGELKHVERYKLKK